MINVGKHLYKHSANTKLVAV